MSRGEGGGWPVVHIVGIGDGGAETLAPPQRALVEAADLLCGGVRHLAFFPEHAAERFAIRSNIAALGDLLEASVGRRRAVVLASGDPCFYGVGPLLAQRLGRERVCIHPVAGSVALAFARLGLPWQDAAVLSAHGRPLASILPRALCGRLLAILTDAENTPARVAEALRRAGMENARAAVCERLGGSAERLVHGRLDDIARQEFDPLNLLVIDRESCPSADRPGFGLDESSYESERGQITKAEVRAITLSKLEPWRHALVWDIGSGSGSLAIELAGQMPHGRLIAIEPDPAQLTVMRRNLARYPRSNLTLIAGAAPEALAGLPAPDGVFIGGSGGALLEVLRTSAGALRPGGRLVANFTLLESVAEWQAFAGERGWPAQMVQVSIARGAPLGGGTHLSPLGPVFVASLSRPEAAR
ncbi:MAG TPA: precorrin-6y C5,15-methyltransferase (decarboxylating) subunit CbiE [Dehalococcoidia bacterium]|nr:precorrin-6y C5,15-methyltransferase (decarboxylating) subunit CbiE [Dehalococcoidia bacterium]